MKGLSKVIDRRQFIKLASISTVGSLTAGTTAATTQAEKKEQSAAHQPEKSVLTDRPILLPRSIINCTQRIPSGKPIQHRLAWKTVADEDKDVLTDIKEAAQYSFIIDGDHIKESEGEWSYEHIHPKEGTLENFDGSQKQWRIEWSYTTTPKSPGNHNFTTRIQFSRPHTSKISENKTRTRSGSYQYSGYYKVVPLNTPPAHLKR